jgi:hypothetical protein
MVSMMPASREIGVAVVVVAFALVIGLAAALVLRASPDAEPVTYAESDLAASAQSDVKGRADAGATQVLTRTLPAYIPILIPNQSLQIVRTASQDVVGSYITGGYSDAVVRQSANQVLVTSLRPGPNGGVQATLDILELPTLSLLQSVTLDPRRTGYTAFHPITLLSEDESTLFYLTTETASELAECASRPLAHQCDRHGIVPIRLDKPISLPPLELPLGCGGAHLTTNGPLNATAVCSLSGEIFDVVTPGGESWSLELVASVSLPAEPSGPFEGNATRILHAARLHSGELSLVLSDGSLVTQSGSEYALLPSPLPNGARPLTVGGDDIFLLDDDRLAIAYAGPTNYSAGKIDGIALVDPHTGETTIAAESLSDVASMALLEGDAFLLLGYDGSYSVLELSGARSSPVPVDQSDVLLGSGVLVR